MDPSTTPFAEQLAFYMDRDGLNPSQLSYAIGLLPNKKGFSTRQVLRLLDGTQRPTTPYLLDRLVQVFKLDDEAADGLWYASGERPDAWSFVTFRLAAEAHRAASERTGRRDDRGVTAAIEVPA